MTSMSKTSTSFYPENSSPRKVAFQTKFKIRGTNQLVRNNDQQNKNYLPPTNSSLLITNEKKQNYSNNSNDKDQFNVTCKSLMKTNFSQHDSEKCLCNQCLCGRHMCKLYVIKPDLRKSSTYQTNFKRAKSIINSRVIKKQYDNSLPKVQMNSTYSFSFRNKEPNHVIKHHPQDQLSFDGPVQKITSYRAHFPGNKGKNPYVRPKQMFASGDFSYKNKLTAYKQSYINGYKLNKIESGKINDQLKTGKMNIFNESFYQQKFKQPNPQDYSPIAKIHQKLEINPNFSHQYQSIYDNDFVQKQSSAVCPAKIKLETKYRDCLNSSKNSFNQNSDFKAFSSSYQALSLAPVGQYM